MAPSTPIYEQWDAWTALLAFVAIILSQIPPIHLLIRPKRLQIEVQGKIGLSHKVGIPNIHVLVGIRNTGGRELRIRSMCFKVERDGNFLTTLPVQHFFETPSATQSVLLVPFVLKPGDSWWHGVQCFPNWESRQVEKDIRKDISALDADIRNKLLLRPAEEKNPVVADDALVKPLQDTFKRLFIWQPGEYILELLVDAEPGSASYSKKYRLTLYESDTAELLSFIGNYKFGGNCLNHVPLYVPLHEHNN